MKTVYYNGRVYTGELPLRQAFAVEDGRFLQVGDDAQLLRLAGEAFTVREALDSFTVRGAEASFEETRKGRIAAGFLADFVVLGADPFETAPRELHRIPVLATYLGGRCVHAAQEA